MNRMRHVTFATLEYSQASWLLARSARRHGVSSTIEYRASDAVVQDLASRFPEIMNAKRGAGYWLWKPFIIRDALRTAADGDFVLYTDAAVVFVADPRPLLAVAEHYPILLFEMVPHRLQSRWTKRDCFVALDADESRYWTKPQLLGGFQLYRTGPEALGFIDSLCTAMTTAHALTDAPSKMGLPELPGFVAHRHDQSILSIVAAKHRVPAFPDPSQWGLRRPRAAQPPGADGVERPAAPYGQIFHVHRKKNWSVLAWYLRNLLVHPESVAPHVD